MKQKKIVLVVGLLAGAAITAVAAANTPKKRSKRQSDRVRADTARDCARGGAC